MYPLPLGPTVGLGCRSRSGWLVRRLSAFRTQMDENSPHSRDWFAIGSAERSQFKGRSRWSRVVLGCQGAVSSFSLLSYCQELSGVVASSSNPSSSIAFEDHGYLRWLPFPVLCSLLDYIFFRLISSVVLTKETCLLPPIANIEGLHFSRCIIGCDPVDFRFLSYLRPFPL